MARVERSRWRTQSSWHSMHETAMRGHGRGLLCMHWQLAWRVLQIRTLRCPHWLLRDWLLLDQLLLLLLQGLRTL